jgi:hypothetical protein
MMVWLRTYWKLFFTERRLSEICRSNPKDFSLWLGEPKNLKPKTINSVLGAGTVASDEEEEDEQPRGGSGIPQVEFEVKIIEFTRQAGKAYVGEELAAEAEWLCLIGDAPSA